MGNGRINTVEIKFGYISTHLQLVDEEIQSQTEQNLAALVDNIQIGAGTGTLWPWTRPSNRGQVGSSLPTSLCPSLWDGHRKLRPILQDRTLTIVIVRTPSQILHGTTPSGVTLLPPGTNE